MSVQTHLSRQSRSRRGYEAALLRDPCSYCGGPAVVLDHIDPRASGGEDSVDNLTAACAACNRQKSARSLLGFLGARRLWEATNDIYEAIVVERTRWNEVGR